jgi:hypothetical protein
MKNSLWHFFYFYYYALRGLLRKQNLYLPNTTIQYKSKFHLTKMICTQWEKLFEPGLEPNKIPFTYYCMEYVKFYLKSMDILRFNYRNILHLGHEIIFSPDHQNIRIGEIVQLTLNIKDISWLDHDRAVLFIESNIEDMEGNNMRKGTDAIFLKGLTTANIEKLKNSVKYNLTDVSMYRNLSKHKPTLFDVKTSYLHVPNNFGARYGKISGDRNPVHTREWLAKLFGYPRAFIQGSATVNFLIKHFISEQQENIKSLSIKFCKPIFPGQTIEIRFTEKKFELVNSKNDLLAFGDRSYTH